MAARRSRRKVKFAAIQMSPFAEKERNLELAKILITRSAQKYDADIIGLPELFNTPFFPFYRKNSFFKLAEEIEGPTISKLSELARELGIFVIAPIFERLGPNYYDSSPIISPNGEISGVYRKSSIPETVWESENVVNHEKFYFRPSQEGFKVFDLGICRLGQLICYDRHFPESWSDLKYKGAQIVYVPNASTGRSINEMFTLETRTMSLMNRVFSVVSNRRGVEGRFSFFGGTHIVAPDGELIAGPSHGRNSIVCSDLDLSQSTGKKTAGAMNR